MPSLPTGHYQKNRLIVPDHELWHLGEDQTYTLTPSQDKQVRYILKKLEENSGSGVIGVFDSGAGGLTVVSSLKRYLHPSQVCTILHAAQEWQGIELSVGQATITQANTPDLPQLDASISRHLFYLGDTANFPYGEKSTPELVQLLIDDLLWLVDKRASVIAIACNTASVIWKLIKPNGHRGLIIDTFSVVAEKLGELHTKKIGVIATHYTVNSRAYSRMIHSIFPHGEVQVLTAAEQPLIGAIEQNDSLAIQKEVRRISQTFMNNQVDTFILGCTHYAHIVEQLSRGLPGVFIINPSVLLAEKIGRVAEMDEYMTAATQLKPAADPSITPEISELHIDVYFSGSVPDLYSLLG